MSPTTATARTLLAVAAVAGSMVGGPLAAVAIMALPSLLHMLRSPDRLMDALYVAAFCGTGILVGR